MYTVLRCHINKDRMQYVTTFADADGAGKYCNYYNSKKIEENDPDSFYTYFYVKGFLCMNKCSCEVIR